MNLMMITRELVTGSNLYYLIADGLEPLKLSINDFNKNKQILKDLEQIPGVYDFKLEVTVSKGKMVNFSCRCLNL